ncbi:MAG: YIP1 family protein [Clostridia bacterium]|nr:YIP1 family protein [Clostridia bacterium]
MKNKLIKFIAVLIAVMTLLPMVISAEPYQTYTYSIDGEQLLSPHAYTPREIFDSVKMGLPVPLQKVSDMVVDEKGNVYLADKDANAIVVLDRNLRYRFTIDTFINSNGIEDSFNSPNGCFVTEDSIYVADTENRRIVIFDLDGNYVRHLEEPKSDIFEDNTQYRPTAIAVDASGRIYVISPDIYQGVLSLNADGEFQGYIGAQKVSYSAWDEMFKKLFNDDSGKKNLPTSYNNITIDDEGFIYCTASANVKQEAITDKSGDYSAIKKFNAAGKDILGRNGFFGPGGEVKIDGGGLSTNPSRIIDVALGPSGSWSIIDADRSKIFTYDQYGNLLFVFGDRGDLLGNLSEMSVAIAYQDSNFLAFDGLRQTITLYTRTEYGDVLIRALQNEIDRKHGEAVTDYQDILKRNSNFDAAYIGIGKALYRQGKYEEAMKMFASAYETENYSKALKEMRQSWADKYFIVIPIVIVVFLFVVIKFFGYAGKVNKRTALKKGKKTFKEEVLYAFHVIFHPFDGFWDLKHEKRGSVRGAIFWLVLALIAICYQSVGRAYVFNPRASYTSMFGSLLSLLVPVALWVIGNWCLTTLFEGEGSMKDIFIATCYCAVPLVLLVIPATAITNILTLSEATIYEMLVSVAWVWVGLLLFFGTMVTHDYSIGKNVLTCIGTIIAMAVIIFCVLLFSTLVMKMVNFITGIVVELSYR